MAEDIERLVAQFDADITKYEKAMTRMGVAFEKQAQAIEKRNSQLISKFNSGWDGAAKGFEKVFAIGAVGVGVAAGLTALVDKSLDAAKSIGVTARNAGVGVETLQKLRYASSQTGGSFELMDEALVTFNKNFGQFLNDGKGKAAQAFKELGLDKVINSGQVRDTTQAFDFIIEKIRGYESAAQRAGFASRVFGQEAGPKLAGFIDAGTAKIAELEKQAESLGIVLSDKTVEAATEAKDKLESLFSVIKAQGVSAIADLAPEIANVTQQLIDGLPHLIAWSEHWADFFGLIKQSPLEKLQYKLDQATSHLEEMQGLRAKGNVASTLFGFFVPSDADIAAQERRVARHQAILSMEQLKVTVTPQVTSAPASEPKLKIGTSPDDAKAAADAAERLQEQQQQAFDRLGVDAKTANVALVAAQNELNVQLLKGSQGYHDAVLKQIEDEKQAKLDEIDATEKKEIDSLAKLKLSRAQYANAVAEIEATANAKRQTVSVEAQAQVDEASTSSFMREAKIAADQEIQSLHDHVAALNLDAGALAKLEYIQEQMNKAREAGKSLTDAEIAALQKEGDAIAAVAQQAKAAEQQAQDAIQLTNDARATFNDLLKTLIMDPKNWKQVLAQDLKNFESDLLDQTFRPIEDYIFGPRGTAGQGLLGGLFGSTGSSSVNAATMTVTAGTVIVGGSIGGTSTASGGLFGQLLNWVFGGGGAGNIGWTDLGINWGQMIAALPTFAEGGIMGPRGRIPLRSYAGGGIASSPQLALFGEGDGPEAFVPLKSGAIPVRLQTPRIPNARAAATSIVVQNNFNVDARYATESTADMIKKHLAVAGPVIADQTVRRVRAEFPENLRRTLRDRG